MITAQPTRANFIALEAKVAFVLERARETLRRYCDERGFASSVRSKTLESLSEKIESGRYASWSEIDDLVAGTVVIPGIADEPQVLDNLRRIFVEKNIVLRGSLKKAPEVFRFDCTRFIGVLPRPETVDPDEPIYSILIEIQIRTAFEHAWSVTTHALTYKNGEVAWERLRLAAQLKATVEQLDLLVLGFEEASKHVARSSWPEMDAKELLANYFLELFQSNRLPDVLRPRDWTRFADNVYAIVRNAEPLRYDSPFAKAGKLITVMENALTEPDAVPTSISLLQFVLATIVTKDLIKLPLRDYCPVITEDVELFFPELKDCNPRFMF